MTKKAYVIIVLLQSELNIIIINFECLQIL